MSPLSVFPAFEVRTYARDLEETRQAVREFADSEGLELAWRFRPGKRMRVELSLVPDDEREPDDD